MAHDVSFHGQMSDSFRAAIFIILSGGFQDAYTYCCRGGVFANAQTGNIVLLSTALFQREWPTALKYLIPILSFMIGIAAAEVVHIRLKHYEKIHWRQIILLCEILLLLAVGFMPQRLDALPTHWCPLSAPCRYRPSTRCGATPMPAPCASAICAPERRRCAPTSGRRTRKFCGRR